MKPSSLICALGAFALLALLAGASSIADRMTEPVVIRNDNTLTIDGASYALIEPFNPSGNPGREWVITGDPILSGYGVVWAGDTQAIAFGIDPAMTYTATLYAIDPDNPDGPLLKTVVESVGDDQETIEFLAYQAIRYKAEFEAYVRDHGISRDDAAAAVIAANARYQAETTP